MTSDKIKQNTHSLNNYFISKTSQIIMIEREREREREGGGWWWKGVLEIVF